MHPLKLNKEEIIEYQWNRPPYLLIDYAEEVIPGVSAKGYWDLKEDLWFFKIHFPRDPSVPGALQLEAMMQMGSLSIFTLPKNKGKIAYAVSANNLKFVKKIEPGDRLYIETKLKSWKRGVGKFVGIGKVKDAIACMAEFTLVIPEIIKEYTAGK